MAIKKIQSEKTSVNASNYNFGSKDNRGNNSSAMRDAHAEDVLDATGFGKPQDRHLNDTASSCFTKQMKDKNYQDQQTKFV